MGKIKEVLTDIYDAIDAGAKTNEQVLFILDVRGRTSAAALVREEIAKGNNPYYYITARNIRGKNRHLVEKDP